MKIITGYTGTKHITPADDAGLHRSMFGSEDYVLASGSQLAAQAESATEIRIADGELVMQGRHARNTSGYEPVAIANGTQGMYRNDLIVARYSVDSSTSVETISLVAITGTAVLGNATDPAHNVGDIDNGETRDFPLYRVRLNGVNLEGIDQLFKVVKTNEELGDYIDNVSNDLEETTKNLNNHNHALPNLTGVLPVSKGGTGATSVAAARKALGLGNTSGAVPVANGGTDATNAEDARANLNAASLGRNVFTANQFLENGVYLFGYLADGETSTGLIGVSTGGNVIIGGSSNPDRNVNLYGILNLNHALGIAEGGTGATTPSAARMSLGIEQKLQTIAGGTIVDESNTNKYGTSTVTYDKTSVLEIGDFSYTFLNIRVNIVADKLTLIANRWFKVAKLNYGLPTITTALSCMNTVDNSERVFSAYISNSGDVYVKLSKQLDVTNNLVVSVTGSWSEM